VRAAHVEGEAKKEEAVAALYHKLSSSHSTSHYADLKHELI
jgi:hypothetical protein